MSAGGRTTGKQEARDTTDDDEAVAGARTGDPAAFAVLVARHTAIAHRTALLFGAGDDAQDVVQEAFVKAFRSLDRFRADAPFRPWLLSIVVNETHNLHRGARRRARLMLRVAALSDVRSAAVAGGADVELAGHEQRVMVLDAVRSLPERDRSVVVCRYLLELSEAETAVALGWPAGTVKSRLSRALHRLRRQLGERLDDRWEVHGG